MKRTYKVTLVLVGAFDRKATASARVARDRARRALAEIAAGLGEHWSLGLARISSSAKRERKAAEPEVQPPPAPEVQPPAEEPAPTVADKLEEIAANLRSLHPRLGRLRLNLSGTCCRPAWTTSKRRSRGLLGLTHKWVRTTGEPNNRCHVHSVESRERRPGQRRIRGTICLSPSWLLSGRELNWTARENWHALLAHEATHVLFPKRRHSPFFTRKEGELRRQYEERFLGGARAVAVSGFAPDADVETGGGS